VQALRETLAKGADRAIHVECSALFTFDPLAVASLLAAAIAPEHFDLVLTGIQSDDLGQGQTGVMLAELLGLPHATLVVEVEKLDGFLRVERELEEGWRQSVELPLPALLTVQSGIRRLRYATLLGIKKARGKQIPTLRAADLAELPGPPRAPSAPMERIYFPPRTQRAQLFEGDARRMAAALVEKLRFEARVL
jgi:electron transfer flavoprotein beta subunit